MVIEEVAIGLSRETDNGRPVPNETYEEPRSATNCRLQLVECSSSLSPQSQD